VESGNRTEAISVL